MRLCVILPSKGRPQQCKEALDSIRDTSLGFADALVIVPQDESAAYRSAIFDRDDDFRVGVEMIHDPFNRGITRVLNNGYAHILGEYDAVMFGADDVRWRTNGWAKMFLDALIESNGGVVFGNDLIHGEELPTHWCVSDQLIQAVGYFALPQLRHICVDVFWKDVGNRLGKLKYLPDVVVEHLHFSVEKSAYDSVYKENNNHGSYHADVDTYDAYATHVLPHEIERIKEFWRVDRELMCRFAKPKPR